MSDVRHIAREALERLAAGLPAFPAFEPAKSSIDRAKRRAALAWLRRQGFLIRAETGELGINTFRTACELKFPHVTDEGRAFLRAGDNH